MSFRARCFCHSFVLPGIHCIRAPSLSCERHQSLYSSVSMRVIAGTYRSRPLVAPRGMATRPTSDRLRETLFNILAPQIEGALFADLYAGTGAVGIEALSRGAAHVTFVENAAIAVAALRTNLTALKIRSGFQLEERSLPVVLRNLARRDTRFTL